MTNKIFDVVVVGAGFAGISAVHKLKKQGLKTIVFEAGGGVGGTWYFNKYPGARCDTHSMEYSYQFSEELQQDWEWSEKYATQPEILRYLDHTVDRFNLRENIRLNTRVEKLIWKQDDSQWEVSISTGELFLTDYVVMATGCLSKPNLPNIKGIDTFSGEIYHTSRWPEKKPDFASKNVGIIGTGSSGIQCIPLIAKEANHLIVYQRTPNYSVPARNEVLSEDFVIDPKHHLPDGTYTNTTGIANESKLKEVLKWSWERRGKKIETFEFEMKVPDFKRINNNQDLLITWIGPRISS